MIPVQMRGHGMAASCIRYTTCVFVHISASRTSGTRAKRIPNMTAVTSPIWFTIRLPAAFWASDINVIHGLKFVMKFWSVCQTMLYHLTQSK